MAITGGCLCGRVRYTISGEATLSAVCHCRNCQRYTGSAFEPIMAFPLEGVTLEGALQTYDDTADSGRKVHRKFCPNCGSGVLADVDAMQGVRLILVGTLDDPAIFHPKMEIFCTSAQPWIQQPAERQQFERMPG